MVVGGSQQETLDPGFVLIGMRQQGVLVILREVVLPGGFDPVSPNFTVRDVTTELSGPRLFSSLKITGTPHWRVPSSTKPGSRVSCRLPPTTI
ncbi:unnamed protein product [Schistosoma mattheei]|uniref:Uncharacterized protein n=1 Tax=Schistosoma mattheei TaxID=31246 RepID=A0A183P6J2_9TREM|nr:unnamed protein product [Schistosoma mattheei]